MKTAVQLRNDAIYHAYIRLGNAVRKKAGTKGEIALFEDGQIVVYIVVKQSGQRSFLFQTDTKNGTETIPGVYPSVNLLIETRSKGRTQRLMNYLTEMEKKNINVNGLREGFFLRLHVLLEERNVPAANFKELLRRWAS